MSDPGSVIPRRCASRNLYHGLATRLVRTEIPRRKKMLLGMTHHCSLNTDHYFIRINSAPVIPHLLAHLLRARRFCTRRDHVSLRPMHPRQRDADVGLIDSAPTAAWSSASLRSLFATHRHDDACTDICVCVGTPNLNHEISQVLQDNVVRHGSPIRACSIVPACLRSVAGIYWFVHIAR
jgi:hypothetical protein